MDIQSMLLLGFVGWIVMIFSKLPKNIFEFIKNNKTCSVSVNSIESESYRLANMWLRKNGSELINRNMSIHNVEDRNNLSSWYGLNYGKFFIRINKCLIFIIKERLDLSAWNTVVDQINIIFIGTNRKKAILDFQEFVNGGMCKNLLKVFPLNNTWDFKYLTPRNFDTIYTPHKKKIIKHLDNWLTSKENYTKRGEEWKTVIGLYGPPGTGKTSIIKAISTYLNANIQMVNLRSFTNEKELVERITQFRGMNVIVFEDIDILLDNTDKDKKNPISLSVLLNIFDGILTPSNCVFIITTNNIDKLSPVLLRPGRVDLLLNIDVITNYNQANEFCSLHNVIVPKNIEFPISPAKLYEKITYK